MRHVPVFQGLVVEVSVRVAKWRASDIAETDFQTATDPKSISLGLGQFD